ncbi:SOS response-associated peptidase [Salipiger bermudensis]|uniref:SOS response-associated peptidase n=1 Tax=Salipiger bermudensis TaxID=344736 RepID=UPI001CD7E201|nr:SOS response-associated peptidase [Salipiger bermudensis]MCA1285326.1 SOS response-associated peptidase [Salipiger bermudensis]
MCGRYAITLAKEAMAQIFEAVPGNDLPEVPNFNVCPTNAVHTVRSSNGTRSLSAMRWGFIPHWYKTPGDGPLLINARAETIAEKPAFRAACRERRCLIPASGFYEWTKGEDDTRLPWYIQPAEGDVLAFAGIWQDWERDGEMLRTCAIVTTAAAGEMTQIHHRVPVILAAPDWALWLGEDGRGAATLMQPAPEGTLRFHRVDREVNSNRASGPQLIQPI